MALFKIFKGQAANLPTSYNDGYCYVTIDDGKMYIDTTNEAEGRIVLNAAHADTASSAEKLSANAGSSSTPVYFSGGVPVACSILEVDTTGTAAWSKGGRYTINFTSLTPQECYGLSVSNDNYDILYGYMEMESGTMAAAPDGYLLTPCETHIHKWTNTLFIYQTIKYYTHSINSSDSTSIDGYTEYWRTNASTTQWTDWQIGTAPMIQAGDTNTPIYINGNGVPTACTSINLNAITATTADKLKDNAGSVTIPVFFSGGVPTPCTSLELDTSGNAATATVWKNARNFTITDGTNTSTAVSVNGSKAVALKLPSTIKANLTGKADTAGTADRLKDDNGSATVPVYFSGGVPTACTSLSLNTTGSAAKWTTAVAFEISDSDGANTGESVDVDGSSAITLTLPAKIKADLTGKADFSGKADTADKLNSNAGSKTLPIYFSAGIPTDCGDTLDVNISKNAATATKLAATKKITISDNDATNTATGTDFDGSKDITLKLPPAIKASLTGKADTAGTADRLKDDNGSASVPVYFSGGVPTKCTSLSLNTTGNAATATKLSTAQTFAITDADGTNTGTGFDFDGSAGGTLKLPATIKATLTGNASTANALTVNGGSTSTPIFFSGGIPTPCTSVEGMLVVEGQDIIGNRVESTDIYTNELYSDLIKVPKSATASDTTTIGAASIALYSDNGYTECYSDGIEMEDADGNVGTLTATEYSGNAATASRVANSLSINGKTYNGSSAIDVGTIGAAYGGTGKTTLVDSCNVLLNSLSTGSSTPTDADYFISQYAGGGTTTTTYHRRPVSALWSYIQGKSDSRYVNISGDTMTGNLVLKNTSLTKGTAPSSSSDGIYIAFTENAGTAAANRTGMLYNYVTTGNVSVTRLYAYQPVASSTNTAYLYVQYGNDGTTKAGSSAPFYGAVWNDYAEFRNQLEDIEPGYCVTCGRDGKVFKTSSRLQYCEGIVSDTFGFSIGETEECKTPLAVSGRVLAYYEGNLDDYEIGDAVCASANGLITKMTREEIIQFPDRIIGTVSEFPSYKTWGDGNVPTENRIWIKVK